MYEQGKCPASQAADDLADAVVSSKRAGYTKDDFLRVAEMVWPMVKDNGTKERD